MTNGTKKHRMGWKPDLPDIRDYTTTRPEISNLLRKVGISSDKSYQTENLPEKVDLRRWCSPIEDQGNLGSCTANAGAGLLEYYERRAFGNYIDASRLFLYKVTRNLIGEKGDTGAEIRNTIGAMVTVGVCPEKYYPYDISKFDEEPSAFVYSLAENYKTTKYVRLDQPNIDKTILLNTIKTNLAAGIPAVFGFTVYSSINQANSNGQIPYPSSKENIEGGHAIDAFGYDDNLKITNNNDNQSTVGAFIVSNSWSEEWGDNGYGYLPYKYVLSELAIDWWTLISAEWVDTGNFGF